MIEGAQIAAENQKRATTHERDLEHAREVVGRAGVRCLLLAMWCVAGASLACGDDDSKQMAKSLDEFRNSRFHVVYDYQIDVVGPENASSPAQIEITKDGPNHERLTALLPAAVGVKTSSHGFFDAGTITVCFEDAGEHLSQLGIDNDLAGPGCYELPDRYGGLLFGEESVGTVIDRRLNGLAMLSSQDPKQFRPTRYRDVAGIRSVCFINETEGSPITVSDEICFGSDGALLYAQALNGSFKTVLEATDVDSEVNQGDFEIPYSIIDLEVLIASGAAP